MIDYINYLLTTGISDAIIFLVCLIAGLIFAWAWNDIDTDKEWKKLQRRHRR